MGPHLSAEPWGLQGRPVKCKARYPELRARWFLSPARLDLINSSLPELRPASWPVPHPGPMLKSDCGFRAPRVAESSGCLLPFLLSPC